MNESGSIHTRRVTSLAYTRSKEEPVILLEGPRSVGKSTLIRALAARFKTQVLDFDNSTIREDAARDPGFYTRQDGRFSNAPPVLIDEYQRVPAILDAIKARMNISSRPGQFIITGSIRHNALPGSVQALTGRMHRMKIYPFAQSEIEGSAPNLVSHILADAEGFIRKARTRGSRETRKSYIKRIVRGGFPLAVRRGPQGLNRWFDDYVQQTLERDIPGITKIRNKRGLYALLRNLAAQSAQVLSIEKLSRIAAIDLSTTRDYIQLLEDVFMLHKLEAWGRTLGSRIAAKPKIHFFDSGIAARLLGLTPEKLNAKEASSITEFGHLLETFVVAEILKELSWLDDAVLSGHWRTHDNKEVDLVLECLDGSVYGFEIKSSGGTDAGCFEGLIALRKFAGNYFKAGFVFYTGELSFKAGDRLYALPISKLWE
ncbi:MAG: ATP-binding protein [Spirochaetaceae bacterium]|jgi:predicted AAA+ superfamily ATPase|nr:ATP-binding protein [Spirochaetaceae bacterium]